MNPITFTLEKLVISDSIFRDTSELDRSYLRFIFGSDRLLVGRSGNMEIRITTTVLTNEIFHEVQLL